MAQCKQSPQEFIKNAFTPQIAVICTPMAEICCQKNNLDFIELLQPFCRLNTDVSYKDPTGFTNIIRNLKLTFLDISWRPPETAVARKLLNFSVTNAPESKNKLYHIGTHELNVPSSTPWFESWRNTFLKVQYPSDHEFTKHFLACILVVSSSESNPEETFDKLAQSLNQVQSREPGTLPKWFNSNVLKYFVVIHDNTEGDINVAGRVFESIKLSYGFSNSFLLRMNSRSPKTAAEEHLPDPWSQFISSSINMKDCRASPENSDMKTSFEVGQEAEEIKNILNYHPLNPVNEDISLNDHISDDEKPEKSTRKHKLHGICLSTEDVEQVKFMLNEFTRSCLMPYIEKQIQSLNDIISNKKGVSKSLFSATKRWFSPNKPGVSSVAVNNLIYSPDSPELQIRRLGDLYFMFGQYSLAFQAYHLAKRDYNTDQAWLYYAGALEMAALAAFMANETTKKTCDYMEESITTYQNTCKMPQFATRATILSSECLKFQNLFGEAAHQLIRMTSEESDLRSALLLEQASYCFLHSKMVRKYAFHMVLAGHRFSKAAQRKYSLKCYKQAYEVYENIGWELASDHIHYTIGRQANSLQHFDEAVESFAKLLKGESKQTAQQQAMFLKEYLTILGNKLKAECNGDQISTPILPVPKLELNSLKVLVGPTRPLSTPGKIPALGVNFSNAEDIQTENKWIKLEEMLMYEADSSPPLVFKPMVTLYTVNKLGKQKPIAIVNEPIQVSLKLVNSLQTLLNLTNICLLWTFSKDDEPMSNETMDKEKDEFVKTYVTKSMLIEGNSSQEVVLSLTPLRVGTVTINGFSYILTSSNGATGTSCIQGKQVIVVPDSTSESQSSGNSRSGGKPLEIDVVPPAPCLQVTFSEMHSDFLADELQRVLVSFQNTSSVPLQNVYMATSVPFLLCNCEFEQNNEPFNIQDLNTPALREKFIRRNHLTSVPLNGKILGPGQTIPINIWVRAPSKKGAVSIDLLIYYENVTRGRMPRYRLVRHSWNLMVQESIMVDVSSQASHNSKTVEELALPMKITNLNKIHNSILTEITLLNVGLLSKYWILTKDIATPKYINLHSQESAHILLKAKRLVQDTSVYSSVPLNNDRKSIQNMSNTFLAFAKKSERPLVTVFDDFETFNFKENKDGILLLQWHALVMEGNKKRIVCGQTNIPIEINRRDEDVLQMERLLSDTFIDLIDRNVSEEETTQSNQKQVSYNLIHPPIIRHSFEQSKICIVPVKILLHSIVDNNILSVIVNTTEPSVKMPTIRKSNLFCAFASSKFCWLGNSKIVKDLNPLMTETIHLSAAISGPGTFDLGSHIQVLCKASDQHEPYVLQSCQIHPTLIVVDVDS